jgi:hypothetical protein
MGVAMRLGIEPDKVRVVAGDIGGSFGLKIGASREELAVAAASRTLGQPVKWVEDRGENLIASGQAREESFDVRAAVSNDGDLLGLDVKMVIAQRICRFGRDGCSSRRGDAAQVPTSSWPWVSSRRGRRARHHVPIAARGRRDVLAGTHPRPHREGSRPDPLEIRLRNVARAPIRKPS